MRVVLVTYGSRGDVQPLVALSIALRSAGHDVLLSGPPERKSWVEGFGVPFHPLGRNITAFLDSMGNAHSIRSAVRFMKMMRKEFGNQFEQLRDVLIRADVAVCSSLAFALPTVAERLNIPCRYLLFAPQLLPSRFHPFMAFKHQGFPLWYNRATWSLVHNLNRLDLTRMINAKRRAWGMPPKRDFWFPSLGPIAIVAADRAIAPVPPDAESLGVQTGYLHLDQPGVEDPGLEAFLQSHPRPLYAGFGSMPGSDQARNVSRIIKAARGADLPAVIGKFWDMPTGFENAEDVYFLKGYPHLKLFPRMAAVLHHGGAGTTATCAVSGVPQVIVPHVLDQYYWGHRVYKAGLGPRPVWRKRLSAERLGRSLRACLSSKAIQRTAAETARSISPVASLEQTVRVIEASR